MDSFGSWLNEHGWVVIVALVLTVVAVTDLRANVRSIHTEIVNNQRKILNIESSLSSVASHLYSISEDLTFIVDQMRDQEERKQQLQRQREQLKQNRKRLKRIVAWSELYRSNPDLLKRLKQLTEIVEHGGGVMHDTEDGNFVHIILPDESPLLEIFRDDLKVDSLTTGEPLHVKATAGRLAFGGRMYAVDLDSLDMDRLEAALRHHRPSTT
jgi:hypothetical protein